MQTQGHPTPTVYEKPLSGQTLNFVRAGFSFPGFVAADLHNVVADLPASRPAAGMSFPGFTSATLQTPVVMLTAPAASAGFAFPGFTSATLRNVIVGLTIPAPSAGFAFPGFVSATLRTVVKDSYNGGDTAAHSFAFTSATLSP
ncbi:MAG TPA: hypothetical protein PK322_03995 [Opitutaceae bacterium]|nr:hypothetical protein [Opitutaceae bacterium]